MKSCYKNHLGQSVDFMDWPYKISESDLYNYEWSYETSDSTHPRVSRLYRELQQKSFKISVCAEDARAYNSALENLLAVTEVDVLEKSPGQLYIGETYVKCYMLASQKSDWHPGVPFLTNTFTIVCESAWIKEISCSYSVGEVTDVNSKKYPYKYPYSYGTGSGEATLTNTHYSDCDFQLVMYGPCVNPHVIVGEYRYQVNTVLELGECLTIDSKARTVKKTMNDGTIVNCFNERQRKPSIFRKIPPGEQRLQSPGTFNFVLTLYAERSEPEWL